MISDVHMYDSMSLHFRNNCFRTKIPYVHTVKMLCIWFFVLCLMSFVWFCFVYLHPAYLPPSPAPGHVHKRAVKVEPNDSAPPSPSSWVQLKFKVEKFAQQKLGGYPAQQELVASSLVHHVPHHHQEPMRGLQEPMHAHQQQQTMPTTSAPVSCGMDMNMNMNVNPNCKYCVVWSTGCTESLQCKEIIFSFSFAVAGVTWNWSTSKLKSETLEHETWFDTSVAVHCSLLCT